MRLGIISFALNDISGTVNPVRNSSDTGYSYRPASNPDSVAKAGVYNTYTTNLTWTTGKNGTASNAGGWDDSSVDNNTLLYIEQFPYWIPGAIWYNSVEPHSEQIRYYACSAHISALNVVLHLVIIPFIKGNVLSFQGSKAPFVGRLI